MNEAYKFKCFQCGQEFDGASEYRKHLIVTHGAPDKFVNLVLFVDMTSMDVRWWLEDCSPSVGLCESFIDGHDGGEPHVTYDRYIDLDYDAACIKVEAVLPEWGAARKQRTEEYMSRYLAQLQDKMKSRALSELYGYLVQLNKLPADLRHHVPEVLFDTTEGKLVEKEDDDE